MIYTQLEMMQKAAKPNSGVPNQTAERLAIVDAVNNEGVVMLQNKDSFLPLNVPAEGEYKVVIVGAWQTNMYFGLYSANSSNSENHIHIQKGITDAIKVSKERTNGYKGKMFGADVLLPLCGITLPFSDTVSYFLFLSLSLALQFAVYYFAMNRIAVTYAVAYATLLPKQEAEPEVPQAPSAPWQDQY